MVLRNWQYKDNCQLLQLYNYYSTYYKVNSDFIKQNDILSKSRTLRRGADELVSNHSLSALFLFKRWLWKTRPPFLLPSKRNDDWTLKDMAANGGSRHEAQSISTTLDRVWPIKKSPSTTGESCTLESELISPTHTLYISSFASALLFCAGVLHYYPFAGSERGW